MNQILQVNNNKKQFKSISIKKVLLFLIIIIVILGLGVGGYYIYQKFINGDIKLPIFIQVTKDTSTITLTQIDRNKLIVSVRSEVGISKITYTLNNGDLQFIELSSGEIIVEETIDMPVGENIVSISVIDIEGKESQKEENFVVEVPKPKIDLSVLGNNIKIVVISEIELSDIIYKWNEENEKKENMQTYENRMFFEKQLEVPIGQNTLTIVATDINGSKTEKTQEIKGVTKAITTIKKEGKYLDFTVKGKENILKVEFEFNGKKYLMNTDTFGETKNVHYKVKLIEGMNYLTVISTTQSGGVDITSYEKEYFKK